MSDAAFSLARAVAEIHESLAAFALVFDADFDVPTPPLLVDNLPTSRAIAALGALYFHAELESSALLLAVEEIARARHGLALSHEEAAAIERYTTEARHGPSADDRRQLFARLFGMGSGTSPGQGGHHAFLPNLGQFAAALVALELDRQRFGRETTAGRERVRAALERLVAGLSIIVTGDVGGHATRVNRLVALALRVLGHSSLQSKLGARSLAGALRALVGDHAVALETAVARGQSGRALLLAAGALGPQLRSGVVAPSGSETLEAARWLSSYHIDLGRAA